MAKYWVLNLVFVTCQECYWEEFFGSRITISWIAFIVEIKKLTGHNTTIDVLFSWAAVRQMESRDRSSLQFCVLKVANSHCYLSGRDKDFFFSTVLYNTRFWICGCQAGSNWIGGPQGRGEGKRTHGLNSWRENLTYRSNNSLWYSSFLEYAKVSVLRPPAWSSEISEVLLLSNTDL